MLKKLTSNIVIYGATNMLKSLVPFLMLPILTTYLTPKDYGILSLIEVSILFLLPFITLNINSAINVEYFHLEHTQLKIYISNAILLSFLSGILFILLAFIFKQPISQALNLTEKLVLVLPIFALLRIVSTVLLGLYQVSEQPIKFASYTIIQTIIDFIFSYILIVYWKLGYIGRLEGIYFAFFIASIYGIYILYKQKLLTLLNPITYMKEILRYGIPLIPHVIGGVIIAMSDRYFISYFIGNDIVGYYTTAYQMGAIMLLVSISINQAWMPILFKMLREYQTYKQQIKKYTIFLFFLYTFIGLVLYLLSDVLFSFFINEKFYMAKMFFPALLLGFMFQSYYYLFTNFLFFQKRTKILAKITFICAILNLILNYFLIHQFGAIGVAYATIITWAIYSIIIGLLIIIQYKKEGLK